jgi:hypothetical protein
MIRVPPRVVGRHHQEIYATDIRTKFLTALTHELFGEHRERLVYPRFARGWGNLGLSVSGVRKRNPGRICTPTQNSGGMIKCQVATARRMFSEIFI